jgi:Protein of unknown function (DUF4230)
VKFVSWIFAMRRVQQIFWVAAVAAVFVAGAWFGLKLTRWTASRSGLHEEDTATVVEQIQALSQLVTVKYVLEKVVVLKDVKWYGENRVLLLAHGIVKAGIDLKRIKPEDVAISGKNISLRLPPPQITDAYLDEHRTRVIDYSTGLFRTPDPTLSLASTARQDAVDDIRRAARTDGILTDAIQRAQLELALFLRQAGFEKVEFVGNYPTNSPHEDVPKF